MTVDNNALELNKLYHIMTNIRYLNIHLYYENNTTY